MQDQVYTENHTLRAMPNEAFVRHIVGAWQDYQVNVRGLAPRPVRDDQYAIFELVRFAQSGISDITNEQVNDYFRMKTANGISRNTQRCVARRFYAFFTYLKFSGIQISLNPHLIPRFRTVPAKQRIWYTEAQIKEVLKFADKQAALLIRISFETGLRLQELTNLRLANLNGNQVLFIGKFNKRREVYMTQETRELLDDYILEHKVTDYLWVSDFTKRPVCAQTIRRAMAQPFHLAGYSDFYPHTLRHSFATNIRERGATLEEIQHMMGHTSILATENYLHGFDGRLGEVFDKYHAHLGADSAIDKNARPCYAYGNSSCKRPVHVNS